MKEFRNIDEKDIVNDNSTMPAKDLLYLLQIAEENEQKYDSEQLDRIYKRARIALDFDN